MSDTVSLFRADAFAGQIFLVTGASSGIGRATAAALAGHGARVVVSGRNEERLQQTLASLAGDGHQAIVAELKDADSVADWIKKLVQAQGAPLAGVFHAAGQEAIRPIAMTKDQHIDALLGPSLKAAFGIARAAASRSVLVDGGSLVMMSSVAALRGQVGMSAYCASKAALDGLVRSLACELAPRKVRVNSVAAAAVKTAMHERLAGGMPGDAMAAYERRHPLGFGEVEDIAAAVLFLLSPQARWITGTAMVVDGGYCAQ
ncbi:SDR family NAD(P)-dependent oxidoreductase [uncultured Ramlibacter sp.]|uniref:SDR family NAD(P)-dependent oxidoreductase n=1 Tax=uncultured Ramlibacter sp. TaxID=260755 RepID=UPI002619CCC1|nr:SDR family oxidoreductase [uncultured Ramlibacter sp.]